ncbi:MAG TPA: RNA polymerase sigma factor [Methylomirabilota bacterium]|nr:RNA polymerase sigma factor [Methylomirabilota bacterium]
MRGDLNLEELVGQHYAALYRFAVSLCGNESEACDLVQETFYLFSTKGHQLNDRSKAKSWLFTTLYRLFTGARRRLIRFPQHELTEVEMDLPEIPPQPPSHFDWNMVLQCLGRLDENFRAPVALFYLDDYSYKEIAEILHVPLGTVKSRIARGIGSLQQMMLDRAPVPSPRTS